MPLGLNLQKQRPVWLVFSLADFNSISPCGKSDPIYLLSLSSFQSSLPLIYIQYETSLMLVSTKSNAMGVLLSIFLCHMAFISFFINLNGKGNMPPACPGRPCSIFSVCLKYSITVFPRQCRGEHH